MKLTQNFSLAEFTRSDTAVKLGINNNVPQALMPNVQRLAEFLQALRDKLGKAIIITSGYRSEALNKALGEASPTSAHMRALAADIRVTGMSPEELFQFIIKSGLEYDQVIQEYSSWVHIGLSEGKPRNQKIRATRNSKGRTVYTLI